MDLEEAKALARKRLGSKRYQHTLNVEEMAVRLAGRYGADPHKAALAALDTGKYGTILRAKGILPGEGEWIHFDYVPGAPEIRRGSADYTGRLCVIGAELDEERIAALFGVA